MVTNQEPGAIVLKDGRLRFNSDNFWKKTYDALIKAADGDFGSAFDTMLSSSDAETPEHKAYRLVFNALHRACVSILTDRNAPDQQRLLDKIERAGLASTAFYHDLSDKLGAGEYAIDGSFFKKPQTHDLLKTVQADYVAFLRDALQVGSDQAAALAAVLPSRFIYELAYEWERADYAVVKTHFDNPFWDVLKKQSAHELRHADLLRRFAKPAFNDPRVTLAEMYIEPQFWVHGSCIPLKKDYPEDGSPFRKIEDKPGQHHFYQHKQHDLLHPFVLKWIRRESCLSLPGEKDSILILLGQPGQGKSSAFLRTIDQMLREHPETVENVFLVRLRDIIHAVRLVDDPLLEIRKHLKLEEETDLKNSLLLLDGLDELYMSQGLTLSQIHDFVRKLRQQLKNNAALSLRAALTSRTNYLKLDDLSADEYLIVHLADLSLEQQREWLRRYRKHYEDCVLTEAHLQEIAKKENKAYQKIRELINQPILLQMIAASGMHINEKANSALIYKQLFDKLIKREWSPEDGQLEKFKKLTEPDLRRFLQTLALHIFQKSSGHEYARRADFEQEGPLKDETERLARKLGLEKLPLKDLVKDLLVSFYFQEVQRDTEEKHRSDDTDFYAYEFLHKSLQEYLVAENIWNTCCDSLLERDKFSDFKIQKPKEAYELIAPLFERKVLTQEIADYLHEIAANYTEADKPELKKQLRQIFPGLLRINFLWKHEEKEGEPAAMDKILGNFFGFWSLASAMISLHDTYPKDERAFKAALEEENQISKEKSVVAYLLILLQRRYPRKLLFSHQNLRGIILRGADLRGANLRGADLRGTILSRVALNRAFLRGADLRGAILNKADLRGAFLSKADFRGAFLSKADFRGAFLSGADLSGALLRGADLSGALLRGADLSRALLGGAYLSRALLYGADLSGTDLGGADLSGADLSGADLSGADLSGADLSGADLSGADLSGTDLGGADLRGAFLSKADLRGAFLSKADLRGADLSGADLSGAVLSGADISGTILWSETWGIANFENSRMEDVKGHEDSFNLDKANFKGTIYEGKFSKEK